MFVPVTIHNNVKVLVNFDNVTSVQETKAGSVLSFNNKGMMDVQETVEQLYDTLRREKK